MRITMITAPDSPDGSEGVLAVVVSHEDERAGFVPLSLFGLQFITDPTWQQQLAYMRHQRGYEVAKHYHPPVRREVYGTPETIVVKSGVVDLSVYTSAGELVEVIRLGAGDVVTLLSGGHGLKVVETAEMFEIKQGPYAGDKDKVRL